MSNRRSMYSPAQEVPSTPQLARTDRSPSASYTPEAVVPDDYDGSQDESYSVPGTPRTPVPVASPWAPASSSLRRLATSGSLRRYIYNPQALLSTKATSSPKEQVVPGTPRQDTGSPLTFHTTPKSRPLTMRLLRHQMHTPQGMPYSPLCPSPLTKTAQDKAEVSVTPTRLNMTPSGAADQFPVDEVTQSSNISQVGNGGDGGPSQPPSQSHAAEVKTRSRRKAVARFRRSPDMTTATSATTNGVPDILDAI